MTTPAGLSDRDALLAALVERIEVLIAQYAALMAENARLAAHVAELEAKLDFPPKTPDNSSLPPPNGQKPSRLPVPQRKAKPYPSAHHLLHPDLYQAFEILTRVDSGLIF